MTGITRYILRHLAFGTVVVTAALAYILWLSQSLGFIELIINKGLSIGTWLQMTLLLLPNVVAIILPIALFFVVIFVYNKMTSDRELVVAQAAGMSLWSLARPALIVAALATVIGYCLTLYYGPKSVTAFKELQWSVRNDVSQVLLREGTFNQLANGLTVYVRERALDGSLRGVLVHDKRDRVKTITLMAEQGTLAIGPNGPRVLLVNGSRQEITRGGGDLSLLYFDSYNVDLGALGSGGGSRFLDNRERPTADLFTLTEEDGLPARTIRRMRVEGHQRLTNPILSIGLTLLALAFVLKGGFDRRGQGKRVILAVSLMVLLEAASLGAANLAAKNNILIPLIYIVAFLPIAFGLYTLAQTAYRPRFLGGLGLNPGSA